MHKILCIQIPIMQNVPSKASESQARRMCQTTFTGKGFGLRGPSYLENRREYSKGSRMGRA